jgi:hypothetical protein
MNTFYNKQAVPVLGNQFLDDESNLFHIINNITYIIYLVLLYYSKKYIPDENIYDEIRPDLVRFGYKCGIEYPKYAEESERYKPVLEKYDAWGK